ncbi:ATP-binding protein [Microbacterium sp.]|uniref:sensor histidine kinase n=1 Tax=Microbacterium sp. TaxID=51671 RepID=UPI0028121F32|nr:ATP-binding protein [Microbacterium sp.]
MSLQTRLMTAVIGFVSLILVIVAVITSATLGQSLEERLDAQVRSFASRTTAFVQDWAFFGTEPGSEITVQNFLAATPLRGPDFLLAISSPGGGISGAVVTAKGDTDLSAAQLDELRDAVHESANASVSISDLGSFRLAVTKTAGGIVVVTGLPRGEILATMTQLFTVIALATLGGLILLALTTAITIRVGLRPLRAVANTATRVANQPLDRGEVSITERVPASEADPRTETGLVGASLNKLLDHVNTSLASRQKNEERMRRFVADASHELRTPLASIRGYSELSLRDSTLPDTAHTALERIQAQSLRMTRLVEDLLLLARLDEGQELVYGSVDLTQLALEELADARPTAPEHHWSVDVPDEPVVIVGDAGRMHQVVANLLANARTHTPPGTQITLSVAQEDEHAVLTVRDNGPGIDEGVREELFARFARGDSSRARQTGGTGLGLAIAKAIVEGHGGFISVTSEPGDTAFTVRIPLRSPAQ